MQKAICCLKMAICLPQLHDLHFTHSDELGIRRMVFYIVFVFAKYWHEAMVSVYAPSNDHQLTGVVKRCPDRVSANAALNALYSLKAPMVRVRRSRWPDPLR